MRRIVGKKPRSLACVALAAILLPLAGCSKPSYTEQVSDLVAYLAKGQIGDSRDYWLVKASSLGSDVDRVALVFGLMNDLAFCLDVADLYMRRYPADRYTCIPAN